MKKIGIIGAMEPEVAELKSHMSIERTVKKASMEFAEGTLKGVPVVVCQCGIGKVNAALSLQILSDLFEVTAVINTGAAGSLNNDLNIGDILISTEAIQHDMDSVALGFQPGQIPGLPEVFKADEALSELAVTVCQEVNPELTVRKGRVVSGDQFISSKEQKERLVSLFHGDCAEMEGASIAQGAYLNNIPFLIIRSISDKADDSAEMDFPTFVKKAAVHSAALVEALVERME